jgi:hypothetical protein
MVEIAKFDNWSECATLIECDGKYTVSWIDKVHGVEPFERSFTNLRDAVRRYNEFMNTDLSRLNLDGGPKKWQY